MTFYLLLFTARFARAAEDAEGFGQPAAEELIRNILLVFFWPIGHL